MWVARQKRLGPNIAIGKVTPTAARDPNFLGQSRRMIN
jgi:hypothetical protein